MTVGGEPAPRVVKYRRKSVMSCDVTATRSAAAEAARRTTRKTRFVDIDFDVE